MQKLIVIAGLFLMIFWLNGQTKYEAGMEKAIELTKDGQLNAATALFERIGQAEPDKWVPLYHAASILINSSFGMEDKVEREVQLEKVKNIIAEAHKRSPDNSELYTLEGNLYLSYLQMSPAYYGMTMPKKIKRLHQKAIDLNPNNPRAYLNMIDFDRGTAAFFGGDMSPYCEQMREIIPKFENQNITVPYAPTYGIKRAKEVANSCNE